MDETIKILREQTVLCSRLPELFNKLIEILKNNSPDVYEPIQKISLIMRELSKSEKKSKEFLLKVHASSFAEYVSAQEQDIRREVAQNLLKKLVAVQVQLKTRLAELNRLLKQGRDFIEFNLNILARISASETYGAQAQTGSQRTRRMFEANI